MGNPSTGSTIPRTGLLRNLDMYVERVAGSRDYGRFLLQGMVFTLFKSMPTIMGSYVRGKCYPVLLKKCGSSVLIEKNVVLNIPKEISLGNRTVIGESSVIDPRGRYGKITIGNDVHIQRWSRITTGGKKELPGEIIVEDAVYMGPFCYIHAAGRVVIGKNSLFGPRVTLVAGNHKYSSKKIPIRYQGSLAKDIIIGEDVWLSANVTVLGGVTVGKGAVIGAGSVVTRDVDPYCVVAGVPARVIGNRE